jgi:hypothetical protein
MRTYESFVEELRELREQIRDLRKEPELSRSVAFKTWNHALSMLIGAMRTNGYRDTGCQVEGRFFASTSHWDTTDPADHFNTALDDTRIELDNIISSYDKHGAPASSLTATPPAVIAPATPRPASSLMPKPGDLTGDWVRANVPFEYAKWAFGAIGVIFFAGIAADRAYESLMSKLASRNEAAIAVGETTATLKRPAALAPRKVSADRPG